MANKQKERNETEFLRGQLRQLKSENKHLKKQLAQANKQVRKTEAMSDAFIDTASYAEPEAKEDAPRCPTCKAGLKHIDLGTRELFTCSSSICKYRFTRKKEVATESSEP